MINGAVALAVASFSAGSYRSPVGLRPVRLQGLSNWSVPMRFHGKVIARRAPNFREKVIALTFDDGPDPTVTPNILATLERYKAKATFFVLGRYAALYPKLVRQAAMRGHAIGVHSYRHPAKASPKDALWEIIKTNYVSTRALGKAPTVFRPPYGLTSSLLTKDALKFGYPVVTWTSSGADTATRDPNTIAYNVIVRPKPGDIVLFHDGYGHMPTALALPKVLKYLQKRGYKFVTVPEMLRKYANSYTSTVRKKADTLQAARIRRHKIQG